MDGLQFQLDMVRALNQQLNNKEKMYQLVCSTSQNAFLYIDFQKNKIDALGKWKGFFDFQADTPQDMGKLLDLVEDKDKSELREILFLEKSGEKNKGMECYVPSLGKWLEFECTVQYENGVPAEKVLRIRDITKFKKQNEDLR